MASRQDTVDFILEQMAGARAVSARKMFGKYGLHLNGRMFAMVCNDQLFVRPTPAGHDHAPALPEDVPYPGANPCVLVTGDLWDDADWLSELANVTAAALPSPKPRTPKAR